MADVVVTGRGIVTSIGETPDAFFDALLHGASGIADGVGACVDFDPEPAMSPKEARRADRYTQLGVKAAMAAAAEAGLPGAADPARTGVILGTGVGGLETLERECRGHRGAPPWGSSPALGRSSRRRRHRPRSPRRRAAARRRTRRASRRST
jgi:3-oxoacyl-[acyl-carrier-protein] synthase II